MLQSRLRPVAVSLLMLTALAFGSACEAETTDRTRDDAQRHGARAGEHGGGRCVGAYRVDLTFVGPDVVRPYAVTLHADGTALVSGAGAFKTFLPGGAGVDFSGTGHGVWRAERHGVCRLSIEIIDGDREGNVSGFSRANVALTFQGGGIVATGTSTALAPDGELRGQVPVQGTGRRLTLQP